MTGAWWPGGWWKSEWWQGIWSGRAADLQPEEGDRAPIVRCSSCGGDGTIRSGPTAHHPPTECPFCTGRGLVRGQLVVSLVDAPTGRVASRSLVPRSFTPIADRYGQAVLDVSAQVRELASALGVPWQADEDWTVPLGYPAEDAASDHWRFQCEAAAIARAALFRPNAIFFSGAEPPPAPTADETLRRLVTLAGDLQLDLLVEVRVERDESLSWGVRFGFPGAELGERQWARFPTLHRALRETSVETALARLRGGSTPAPARWLETSAKPVPKVTEGAVGVTWAELSARLTPLAVPAAGAIGIHRQGEWHVSALESAPGPADDLGPRLRPVVAAPEPAGLPIPSSTCPKCRGNTGTRCHHCLGSGRELDGLALTITDLKDRTKHVNWSVTAVAVEQAQDEDQDRHPASGHPLRPGEILLDRQFSVAEQAQGFGIPPHLLHDHERNAALDLSLVDGRARGGGSEPAVSRYLRVAARRRPAGRLIVLARPEPEPPIGDLFRAVLGLGLTLAIRVRSAGPAVRPPAPAVVSWKIQVLPGTGVEAASPGLRFGSPRPSLRVVADQLQAELGSALRRALKVGDLDPLPVPEQADPITVDLEGLELSLEGLCGSFPGTDLTLCLTRAAWTCHLAAPYHRLVSAPTLADLLRALIAIDLVEPDPEDLRRIIRLLLDESSAEAQLAAGPGDLQARLALGLAIGGLLKSLFAERFGPHPEPDVLAQYAAHVHRVASELGAEDEAEPPAPAAYAELLAAYADPTRTGWQGMLLTDHLSVMLDVLGSLVLDSRNSGTETSAIIEQAVEAGMLMARQLTGRVERREQ